MADLDSIVQQKQIALKYANAEKQLALSDSNFYNQPKEVQQQAIISTVQKEDAKNMSLTQFKETYGGSNPSVNPNIAPIIRQEMDDAAAQVWDQVRKDQIASIQPRTVLDDVITGLKIGSANVIGGTADLGAAVLPGKQETLNNIGDWARETTQAAQGGYSTTAQAERTALTQATADAAAKAEAQKQYLMSTGSTEEEANQIVTPLTDQVIAGVSQALDSPRAAMTYAVEAAPTVAEALALGYVGKAVGLARTVTGADEVLAAAQQLKNAKQGARIAAGIAIAKGEAGGVVSGVREFTQGLSDKELSQVPGFADIQAKNPNASPEELRKAVADNASVIPALGQGLLALAISKGTGALDLEAGIAGKAAGLTAIPRQIMGGGIRETVEEIPQGVTGQVAQNLAMQDINPDQQLSEGVVDAGIQSLLGAYPSGAAAGAVRSTGEIPKAIQQGKDKLKALQTDVNQESLRKVDEVVTPTKSEDGTTVDPSTDGQDIKDLKRGAANLRRQYIDPKATEEQKQNALVKFMQLRNVAEADYVKARKDIETSTDESGVEEKRLTALGDLVQTMGAFAKDLKAPIDGAVKERLKAAVKERVQPMTDDEVTQFKSDIRHLATQGNDEDIKTILEHIRSKPVEEQQNYEAEIKALTSALELRDVVTQESAETRKGITTGTSGFKGLINYVDKIRTALAANKFNSANEELTKLSGFIQQRESRLNKFSQAYEAAKAEAESTNQVSVIKQIADGFPTLATKPEKGSGIEYIEFNKKHRKQGALVTQQQEELDYLKKGYAALTNLVTGLSPVVKNTTQSTEAPVVDSTQSRQTADKSLDTESTRDPRSPVAQSIQAPDAIVTNDNINTLGVNDTNVSDINQPADSAIKNVLGIKTEKQSNNDGSSTYRFSFNDGHASVLTHSDGTAHIMDVQIGDGETAGLRGKGVGTKLYEHIGNELAKDGVTLESTRWSKHKSAISPAALRVWEKLEKAGAARVVGHENARVLDRFSGVNEVRDIPIYEFISAGKETNQATVKQIDANGSTSTQTTIPTFIDRLPDLHDYANELVDGRSRLSNERLKEEAAYREEQVAKEAAKKKGAAPYVPPRNASENTQWRNLLKPMENPETSADVLQNPIKRYFTANKEAAVHKLIPVLQKSFNEAYAELSQNIDPANTSALKALNVYITEIQDMADAFEKNLNAKASLPLDGKTTLRASVLSRLNRPMNNFRTAEGKIIPEIIYAMAIAGTHWFNSQGVRLNHSTESQIASVLGVDEKMVTYAQMDVFQGMGVPRDRLTSEIGKAVLQAAGLKSSKDAPLALDSAITSNLGMEILTQLFNEGKLEVNNISNTVKQELADDGYTSESDPWLSDADIQKATNKTGYTTFIRLTDEIYETIEDTKYIREQSRVLESVFKTPKTERHININVQGEVSARINNVTKAPPAFVKKAKAMAAVPYKIDQTFDSFLTGLGESLKFALGYKPLESTLHYTDRLEVAGKNKSIQDSLDRLAMTKEALRQSDNGLDSTIHYNYGFTSMGRMAIRSDELNPHLHKLHRHIAPVADAFTTFNPATEMTTDTGLLLHAAIAQGLGFKTDRYSLQDAVNYVQAFNRDNAEIVDEAVKVLQGESANTGLFSSVVDDAAGLKALMTLAQIKIGKPFQTSITYEVDGLANGTSVSVIQYGLSITKKGQLTVHTKENLARAGFHTEAGMTNANYRALHKGMDAYEKVAKLGETEFKKLPKELRELIKYVPFNPWERSNAKPIVNTANYGAGDQALKNVFLKDTITYYEREIYNARLAQDTETEKTLLMGLHQLLSAGAGVFNSKVIKEGKEFFSSDDLTELRLSPFATRLLGNALSAAFGEPYVTAYEKVFGAQRARMSAMIKAHNLIAEAYNSKSMKEIKGSNSLYGPSLNDIHQHIESTKDIFPSFKFSDSTNVFDGLSAVTITNDTNSGLSGDIRAMTKPVGEGNKFGLTQTRWHSSPTLTWGAAAAAPLFTVYLNDAMTMKDTDTALKGVMVWDALYLGLNNMREGGHELNTKVVEAAKKNNALFSIFDKANSPEFRNYLNTVSNIKDNVKRQILLGLQTAYEEIKAARDVGFENIHAATQFIVPDQTTEIVTPKEFAQATYTAQTQWQDMVRHAPVALSTIAKEFSQAFPKSNAATVLAAVLLDLASNTKIRIMDRNSPDYLGKGDGYYDRKTNTVVIADDLTPEQTNETAMHELVHSVTSDALFDENPSPSVLKAKNAVKQAYAAVMADEKSKGLMESLLSPYGELSEDKRLAEFMSLALTDKGMQQILSFMRVAKDDKVLRAASWKGRELISRLLEKVSQFLNTVFGLTPTKLPTDTMFSALIGLSYQLKQSGKKVDLTAEDDSIIQDHIRDMNMRDVLEALPAGVNSTEHQTYLSNWVNEVQRVLGNTHSNAQLNQDSTDADLYEELGLDKHLPTAFELAGLQMSAQEKLAYELTHVALTETLSNSVGVRNTARDLYKNAKSIIQIDSFIPKGLTPNTQEYLEAANQSAALYAAIFKQTAAVKMQKDLAYLPHQIEESKSQYLEDFMSLALTNEQVRNVLASHSIKPEKIKVFKGNPLDMLVHVGQIALRSLNNFLLNQSGEFNNRVTNLGLKLVDLETRHKHKLVTAVAMGIGAYTKTLNSLAGQTKNIVGLALEKSGLLQAPKATVRMGTFLLLSALNDQAAKKLALTTKIIHDEFASGKQGLFSSLFTEAQGVTEDNQKIVALHTLNNKLIDEESNAIRATTQNVLKQSFARSLTEKENHGLYSLLKADVVSLIEEGHTLDDLRRYLTDNATIIDTIHGLANQVGQIGLGKFSGYYQRMSENMGYMMATGVAPEFGTVLNTRFIAERLTPGVKQATKQEADQVQPLIEQMASLYALFYTQQDLKTEIANLITSEGALPSRTSGVQIFLDAHQAYKKESHKALFDGNEYLITKGYVKDTFDPNRSIMMGTTADIPEFKKSGYKPISKLSSGLLLFMTDQNYLPAYNQGALSTAGLKAKGTDLQAISAAKGVPLSKVGLHDRVTQLNRQHTGLLAPRTNRIQASQIGGAALVPVLNSEGTIVNYRYMMSEQTKIKVLNKMNDGIMAVANLAANTVVKTNTAKVNAMVVAELANMWSKDKFTDQAKFYVPISEHSTDPELRESYLLLPKATRMQIKDAFGGALMVRRDLVLMTLGARTPTAANAWNSDGRMNKALAWLIRGTMDGLFKGKGKLKAQQLESTVQALMKEAKFTTVVKSGVVQAGNIVSNTWQLMMHGVDPITAVKNQYRGMEAGQHYIKNTARIRELRLLLDLESNRMHLAKYQNELIELEAEQAASPIKPLVDEGLMTSFVEDLSADTLADQYSKRNKWVSKIDNWKEKQAKPVQSFLDFVTAGRKTEYTQTMLDITRYGDLGARYALYQHLKKTEPQMSEKQRIMTLSNEFVNYDLPTHPTMQYLDSVGLLWFPRYYIRMQRPIFNMIQKNPAMYLTELLSEKMFTDMDTPMDNGVLMKHPWNKFTLFGPIRSAPFLLPAVNAVD